jgi:hypothetical protein
LLEFIIRNTKPYQRHERSGAHQGKRPNRNTFSTWNTKFGGFNALCAFIQIAEFPKRENFRASRRKNCQ